MARPMTGSRTRAGTRLVALVAAAAAAVGPACAQTSQDRAFADGYSATRVFNRRGRTTLEMREPDATISIDVATGLLVEFFNRSAEPPRTDARLSEDDARRQARHFLARWSVLLDAQWNRERVDLVSHGGDYADYVFVWERCVDGVYLPAWCTISLDAHTGRVRTFTLGDDAVTVPLAWRVPVEQAVDTAARARGWAGWDLEEVQLHVGYRGDVYDGKNRVLQPVGQAVLWRVKLWGPEGRGRDYSRAGFAQVEVDAVTGEIAREYICSGPAKRPGRRVFERAKKLLVSMPKPNPNRKLESPPTIFQTLKSKRQRH